MTHTMINGRPNGVATMKRIAPGAIARRPLFCELPGGVTVRPATARRLERLARFGGWH